MAEIGDTMDVTCAVTEKITLRLQTPQAVNGFDLDRGWRRTGQMSAPHHCKRLFQVGDEPLGIEQGTSTSM